MSDRWQVVCKHGTYDDFANPTAAAIWLVREHCTIDVENLNPFQRVNEEEYANWLWHEPEQQVLVCAEAVWTPAFHVIQPQ